MSRDTPKPENLVVRTATLPASAALHLSHPLNDRSELHMTRLSDVAGLSHIGVSIARVPPGRESFALHAHTLQEEWIFVLSGAGEVQLDDDAVEIGPGDFVGFPANGPAHLVRNTGSADLVFLQGGDRRPGDRGRFPELGLIGYEDDDGHMALIPEEAVTRRPFTDWLADADERERPRDALRENKNNP